MAALVVDLCDVWGSLHPVWDACLHDEFEDEDGCVSCGCDDGEIQDPGYWDAT